LLAGLNLPMPRPPGQPREPELAVTAHG
jgi:hypothetical protein